jgi:hypothetical protein
MTPDALRYRRSRSSSREGAHAHPGFNPGRIGGGGGQGIVRAMIPVLSGVRVWLAVGHTDMRGGMNSLALQVQEVLNRDPHAGDLYVFRRFGAKPRKNFVDDQAASPSSWKTPRMAVWMAA